MYELTKSNGTVKLRLFDSCSIADAQELKDKLLKMLKKSKTLELSIDDATEIDTSHLQIILSAQKTCELKVSKGEEILKETLQLYGCE